MWMMKLDTWPKYIATRSFQIRFVISLSGLIIPKSKLASLRGSRVDKENEGLNPRNDNKYPKESGKTAGKDCR
jgi:hypothetical protein